MGRAADVNDYRITSSIGADPETTKYAVIADTRESCLDGVAAATDQVTRAGGAALFEPPRQMMCSSKWLSSGTAVIFGRTA